MKPADSKKSKEDKGAKDKSQQSGLTSTKVYQKNEIIFS